MPTLLGEVFFLDVGQGHAALALTAHSDGLLVDCPWAGSDAVLSVLNARHGAELRAVVITHRDVDQCGGIRDVIRNYRPDVLYLNASYAVAPTGRAGTRIRAVLEGILDQVDLDNVESRAIVRGDAGNVGILNWRALAPEYDWVLAASLTDKTNRSSVVLVLQLGPARFLITGDADAVVIDHILSAGDDVEVDVVLIPHHGATLRNLDQLLASAKASHAIISAGRSAGIHPTEQTLRTVAAQPECRLMCTQVNRYCHSAAVADPTCAGTVRCVVTDEGLFVEPNEAEHIERMETFERCLCLETEGGPECSA